VRVLLVRTSSLGDVVHCLPVLTALKRHRPQARIGWVVEEAIQPLLAGHPDLDQVVAVRSRSWRRRPLAPATAREVGAFLEALDRFAPDVVLDLMGNHKAGVIAALTQADRRLGLAWRHRREPSSAVWISDPVTLPAGPPPHAVDRALALLGPLGVPPAPVDFGGERLLREVPRAADDFLAARPGPGILIHPGAAWGSKRYPPERWGEVARRLRAAVGPPLWIAAGPGEQALADAVGAASDGAAEAVAAPSLAFLAALLRHSRLVLGGDTGPVHLAHALGVPVLCLMGPTDPARHGPYGDPEAALWRRLPCSFCYRRYDETKACLLEIPVRAVVERALARLEARRPPAPMLV
jgi:heptosyltransferase-1